MGYTTEFNGVVKIDPPLNPEQVAYINAFNHSRRMKRNVEKLMEHYNGKFGYPFATENTPEAIYGVDGEYFVHEEPWNNGKFHESIIDYNTPPGQLGYDTKDFNSRFAENEKRTADGICQPGLWCQWEVSEDGTELKWDGGEKFYNYVEWMKYLVNHFFSKWNVLLNGQIHWAGEDSSDLGKIKVKNNVVTEHEAVISFKDDEEDEE